MTAPAAIARDAALHCEVKKDGLRQTQDGLWKITFTVAPTDMPQPLMAARPGTRYMLALVEIGDDEQPIANSGPLGTAPEAPSLGTPEPQAPEGGQRTSGAASSQDAVVKRCAILCEDAEFQRWLRGDKLPEWPGTRIPDHEWTVLAVRALCGVSSRRDLALNITARNAWLRIEDEFLVAAGRRTWRRPDERRAG